jgi:hypothetical protein
MKRLRWFRFALVLALALDAGLAMILLIIPSSSQAQPAGSSTHSAEAQSPIIDPPIDIWSDGHDNREPVVAYNSRHDMSGVGVREFGGDTGVYGSGEWMAGVRGESEWGLGVFGTSSEDYGVGGYSTNSDGVHGHSSGIGNGVGGEAITGTGVSGQSRYGPGGEFRSDYGHALVTDGPSLIQGPNPQQVALLKWYLAIQTPMSFTVGNGPNAIAFDGANMWVVNWWDDTVSKR